MTQLSDELRAKITSLIASDDVVLFMKGTREAPRCGFSAAVVDILDGLIPKYRTVDVLADPDLREGIKAFSDWPTIPQLYIKGEFIGGADITKEMHSAGELAKKLGVTAAAATGAATKVDIEITPTAADALKNAQAGEPPEHKFLRISVNSRFQHGLCFGPELAGDGVAESAGISIRVDAGSVARAQGLKIDAVTQPGGVAFRLINPNEPASVKMMSATELKQRLDEAKKNGTKLELFDVRSEGERAMAKIEESRIYDESARKHLESLPKDTTLVFHCHHGGRSQRAAEEAVKMGFKSVFNIQGGIDAWAREVDPTMKRY